MRYREDITDCLFIATTKIITLEQSLKLLQEEPPDSLPYEVFRNATIKGNELTFETAGTLLKKTLKPYFANAKDVDLLVFKDLFRHAAKHGLLTKEEVQRWFLYRDNRNNTAHDDGRGFAEETLKLLPQFIQDAKSLKDVIDHAQTHLG